MSASGSRQASFFHELVSPDHHLKPCIGKDPSLCLIDGVGEGSERNPLSCSAHCTSPACNLSQKLETDRFPRSCLPSRPSVWVQCTPYTVPHPGLASLCCPIKVIRQHCSRRKRSADLPTSRSLALIPPLGRLQPCQLTAFTSPKGGKMIQSHPPWSTVQRLWQVGRETEARSSSPSWRATWWVSY